MEEVNWESLGIGAATTFLASMVAEPVTSTSLRGSVLAQELAKVTSDAGVEVFQQNTGMIMEA